jgi:hypothetical protein
MLQIRCKNSPVYEFLMQVFDRYRPSRVSTTSTTTYVVSDKHTYPPTLSFPLANHNLTFRHVVLWLESSRTIDRRSWCCAIGQQHPSPLPLHNVTQNPPPQTQHPLRPPHFSAQQGSGALRSETSPVKEPMCRQSGVCVETGMVIFA